MPQPLYRFRLDTETGDIKKSSTENYSEYRPSPKYNPNKIAYKANLDGQRVYPNKEDIDTMKNWSVYSFNPDLEHAKQIFKDAIWKKRVNAHEDYLRFTAIAERIETYGQNS